MSETILDYIGLNLNRISKNIKGKKPQYNTAKAFDNSALYKVYKKIPLWNHNRARLTTIGERIKLRKKLTEGLE